MWSPKQQLLFLKASNIAGWNDQQRYVAMRACGCPLVKGTVGRGQATEAGVTRPSIKAPGNTHESFAAVMVLAEASAEQRGRGAAFPRPSNADSWLDSSRDTSKRVRDLVRRVWAEACERMPGRFFGGEAALDAFVKGQLARDPAEFPEHFDHAPEAIDECDLAQAARILESLKAWVGREFYRAGITPRTFYIPSSAIAQVNAEARRHVSRRQAPTQETAP